MTPHKKPIGENGPLRVSQEAGRTKIDWQRIQYSPEKSKQERSIADSFITALNAEQNQDWKLTQLEENDFDFQIEQPREKRYLELQEIIIPGKKHGSPYVTGEQVIQPSKFAKTIIAAIVSKSVRYPTTGTQPLDLLNYVTHWRFRPNDTVIKLVVHGLTSITHPFSRIYFYERIDAPTGLIKVLYPNPELIRGFAPNPQQEGRYLNFDPASASPTNKEGNVGVTFRLSSDAMKKLGLGKNTGSEG